MCRRGREGCILFDKVTKQSIKSLVILHVSRWLLNSFLDSPFSDP